MTRELGLLKADVNLIAMIVRLRGAGSPGQAAIEGSCEGEDKQQPVQARASPDCADRTP
jgi:hypothetical protein